MFFGGAFIVGGWGVVGWGRKSYLEPAGITSFSSQDFSRNNKHVTFGNLVSTGYFYVLFLWGIAVSYFCLLEIYKNFDLSLSTITLQSTATQITISINIFVSIIYSIKSVFLLKYTLRFFTAHIFFNKNHGLQKRTHYRKEKFF